MTNNQISIVVAISENRAIGKDNRLLWHLPADLKHFKAITGGHTIIMGRKTFDSIGKALPNRRNIVISRNTKLEAPGAEIAGSLSEALRLSENDDEVFIIGGAEIYRQALPLTHKIYLTIVHQHYEADAFFPETDLETWKETSSVTFQPDEKNNIAYSFLTLERIL